VETAVVLAQMVPLFCVQPAGAVGHVHRPVPAAHVCTPGHATTVPHTVQPLVPATQVCVPPPEHWCAPSVHAFVHVGPESVPASAPSVAPSVVPASVPPPVPPVVPPLLPPLPAVAPAVPV